MSLTQTLLPRSYMLDDAHDKLTSIQHDVQKDFTSMLGLVTGAYEIDTLSEADLVKLMASFSILDTYNALPAFYHGATQNSAGTLYTSVLPGGKLYFMKTFTREMLKVRKDLGIVAMFDPIMGLLGMTNDAFIVFQDFWYHNGITGVDDLRTMAIYYSTNVSPATIAMTDTAPLAEDFFPDGDGSYYTPTQTVTVDLLTAISMDIAGEFIAALKTIINFLKPTHVIFKDITPSIYLSTDMNFGISMTARGDFVEPQKNAGLNPVAGAPDFRTSLTRNGWVEATDKKIYIISGDFIDVAGIMPGMVVNVTGLTGANNLVNARIIDVDPAGTWIQINAEDGAAMVDEGSIGTPIVSIIFNADYDHSFEDALVSDVMVINASTSFYVVGPSSIKSTTYDFTEHGLLAGMQITVSGFTDAANNFGEASLLTIVSVSSDTLELSAVTMVNESAGPTVTITQVDDGF